MDFPNKHIRKLFIDFENLKGIAEFNDNSEFAFNLPKEGGKFVIENFGNLGSSSNQPTNCFNLGEQKDESSKKPSLFEFASRYLNSLRRDKCNESR